MRCWTRIVHIQVGDIHQLANRIEIYSMWLITGIDGIDQFEGVIIDHIHQPLSVDIHDFLCTGDIQIRLVGGFGEFLRLSADRDDLQQTVIRKTKDAYLITGLATDEILGSIRRKHGFVWIVS